MKKIFNIFSRRETHKKEQPKIIIDYREKNSLIPSELINLGLTVEFKNLKVADYIIKGVAIERKTISDFVSSMTNRRLIKQLEELTQYKDKLLIVEGIDEQELYTDSEEKMDSFGGKERSHRMLDRKPAGGFQGMHPNSIRGFLLSILLKYKIPIIFTKNYEDTAKFLSVLSKGKPREIPLNVKKKALNKKEQLQLMIEGFPGIGPKTSKKLLKKFHTIKNIINISEEELKDVIGKKAETMKRIIDSRY